MLAVALALGCERPGEPEPTPPDFAGAPSVRATLVFEPPVLHIGEIMTLELAVVTPPHHRVPAITPVTPPGLELLGARSLAPELGGNRWVYRTQLRVRAQAIGTYIWPPLDLTIERPDGSEEIVRVAQRRFEVRSVREDLEARTQPFGLQQAPVTSARSQGSFLTGLLFGLAAAAIALASWWVGRRLVARRPARHASPSQKPTIGLRDWTHHELDEALSILDADPRRAASAGAHLLRVYMSRRFGSETEASTTEELERHSPALAERSLWPDFIRILHSFDDERFRPHADPAHGSPNGGRIRSALEASRRLVEISLPGDSAGANR